MTTECKAAEVELQYMPTFKTIDIVRTSLQAYCYLLPTFDEKTIHYKESFKVLLLNKANQVLGWTTLADGAIDCVNVDVRIIMQVALLTCATQIIVAHNHPSGNLRPSVEDKRITQKIAKACEIMNIRLVDHLIMTDSSYYSFNDEGGI